jgi:hypothetical protein
LAVKAHFYWVAEWLKDNGLKGIGTTIPEKGCLSYIEQARSIAGASSLKRADCNATRIAKSGGGIVAGATTDFAVKTQTRVKKELLSKPLQVVLTMSGRIGSGGRTIATEGGNDECGRLENFRG